MTHPTLHAESSARLFGGQSSDWLPVHLYLDDTKKAFGDFRHRAFRHHEQGALLCATSLATDPAHQEKLYLVAEQHIREDCGGRLPTIEDWLDCFDVDGLGKLDKPVISTSVMNQLCAKRFNASPDEFAEINDWIDGLDASTRLTDSYHSAARYLRHHSMGCFEVEEVFGRTMPLSNGHNIPTRYIAEYHNKVEFGYIPAASEWASLIKHKIWMSRASFIRPMEALA
ncbi:hypothetical protein [Reinekea sp. G2M2-21]|uniref:DUF6915 family protein n=1 Tax=Reinekea sp. G2M2-21 TaxID=2788942 RepID=UPI0018AA687A|nr:hypothetical protein [Reinekea sp. G2M2-21]